MGGAAPLEGRTIVVTRAADQAAALVTPLAGLGAEVLLMPVLAVVEPLDWSPADAAIESLGAYAWVVLSSANGVDAFDTRLLEHGLSLARMDGPSIAVVGKATAARVRELGAEPALVPEHHRAEGLIAAFAELGAAPGTRVLIARAAEARDLLPAELRERGFAVDVVPTYRLVTATPPPGVLERLAAGGVDAITFASGGTARRFVDVVRAAGLDAAAIMRGSTLASIGPVTTKALAKLGFEAGVEASEATTAALAAAIAEHFAKGP